MHNRYRMDKCGGFFAGRSGFTLQRARAIGTADVRRIKRAQELPPCLRVKKNVSTIKIKIYKITAYLTKTEVFMEARSVSWRIIIVQFLCTQSM